MRRRDKGCIFILAVFLHLFFFSVTSFANDQADLGETIIVEVYLNTKKIGSDFVNLTKDGDILIPLNSFKDYGIKRLPKKRKYINNEYLSLKSTAPSLTFKLEEMTSSLYITAHPKLLPKYREGTKKERPKNPITETKNSIFLNYGINYYMGDEFEFTSYNIPWETGLKLGSFFIDSNFSYTKTDFDEKLVRTTSNITYDSIANERRYILGDFYASSGELGSNGNFGGLSISKEFSINPYKINYPQLSVSGMLFTPSIVDIYINEAHVITSKSMEAGEFELFDLQTLAGAGDVLLVIKDAYGHEKRITIPFYLSSKLLRQGLNEYSYNVGYERESFGQKSDEYNKDLTSMVSHRIGITDWLTIGFRGEGKKAVRFNKFGDTDRGDVINYGPTLSLVSWKLGETELAYASSNEKDLYGVSKRGGAFYFSHYYKYSMFNFNFILRGQSKSYSNLLIKADDTNKFIYSENFRIGINQKTFGSLTLSFNSLLKYGWEYSQNASITYSRQLFDKLSISLSGIRRESANNATNEFKVFLTSSFRFGESTNANVRYSNINKKIIENNTQRREEYSTVNTSISKNAPIGTGFGYRISSSSEQDIDNRDNWRTDGQASVDLRLPFANLSASYSRTGLGQENASASLSGGIAYIDGSVHFTKPLRDAFALVRMDNLKGVSVKVNNQELGKTDSDGELLAYTLSSYHDNTVSIDPTDLPLDYSMDETSKVFLPPYRGTGVLEFSPKKFQAYEGHAYFIIDGVKTPAKYAGLSIEYKKGEPTEMFVGDDGAFYFENIPAGTYPARLWDSERECKFDIVIPKGDDIIINIGDIICETD